jgi:DNA polymerase-4
VEPLSLDEAYLDVTLNKPGIASAMAIARAIKQAIRAETQLTASAGVSYNKFLAKLASGLDKPDGLYLIAPEQGKAVVESLPIAKFYGVGAATAQKMQALGIHTGFDLKQWSEAGCANTLVKQAATTTALPGLRMSDQSIRIVSASPLVPNSLLLKT